MIWWKMLMVHCFLQEGKKKTWFEKISSKIVCRRVSGSCRESSSYNEWKELGTRAPNNKASALRIESHSEWNMVLYSNAFPGKSRDLYAKKEQRSVCKEMLHTILYNIRNKGRKVNVSGVVAKSKHDIVGFA